MTLILEQSGMMPLGMFDGLDAPTATLKGGELVTFTTNTLVSGTDQAAADVYDGYTDPVTPFRPALTTTVTSSTRPLFLADEGSGMGTSGQPGYGTLFGQIIGSAAGKSTSGAALGPHTTAGSGKVTIYNQPGFYAVTLDAVDTTAGNGLVVNNSSLTPGSSLTYTALGLLTPVGSANACGSTVVGKLVEFASTGSLVTTPTNLVASLNSPSGSVSSSPAANRFVKAVFYFYGA